MPPSQPPAPAAPSPTAPSTVRVLDDDASAGVQGLGASFSPLYQQIKGLILRSLQVGEWKPGDMIPSEFDLAARFRVSQGTVRKAIDELATDNLLVRRQGKGTFVATHAEQHTQYRFLRLVPDAGNLDNQGPATRQIIECKRLRAPADVARQLQLRTGDPVQAVKRVLSFGGQATIVEELWLPGGPFKGLNQDTLTQDQGPMYALFEAQFGVRMVRAEEKIKAVGAQTDIAELLSLDEGAPVLMIERLAYTYNDVPMELRRAHYRTDAHHYRNELS